MKSPDPVKSRSFLQRRFLDPVRGQLLQGAEPEGLAKAFAIGASLALIPVLGVATPLCVFVGLRFRLNQPILQTINYLLYPLQLLLVPLFLKSGAWAFQQEPIVFNLAQLTAEFKDDAGLFFRHYGLAGFHAFLLWLAVAPFFAILIYQLSLFFILRWKKKKHLP